MAKKLVKCPYCNQEFDRNTTPFVTVGRRFAHSVCADANEAAKSQDQKDKDSLESYINKLFGTTSISTKVQRQIKEYINNNGYTYSGILKSLIYFYEIKNGNINNAKGGIGIVPYVYDEARDYYYSIWLAQTKNKDKDIEKYKPQKVEVYIKAPERKPRKRRIFSFLDKEE